MNNHHFKFWHYGFLITVLLSSILGYNLLYGDKRLFISGPPTHGHHQIEMSCNSCHGEPFADSKVMQLACESCHLASLDKFSDTHPKSKFTDPRNTDLLAKLDATACVTCHREHKPEITRDYGVTLAKDFCAHCHQGIAQERASHADFGFESCASAGCHNYHDNTALYENFLRKHVNGPWLAKEAILPELTGMTTWLKKNADISPLLATDIDAPEDQAHPNAVTDWASSYHAQASVNCTECHQQNGEWLSIGTLLKTQSCLDCHSKQGEGFKQGKHGMRLADALVEPLSNMSPALAKIPMQKDAHNKENTCVSCHQPHKSDLTFAAVEACLGCHNDEHSNNFKGSEHGKLWLAATEKAIPVEQAVSCATCHLPRIKKGKNVHVEHNQNANLQPNSKMIRSVCINCHGVEFSLATLADKALIKSNFSTKPDNHHNSMDLIRDRINQRKQKQSSP